MIVRRRAISTNPSRISSSRRSSAVDSSWTIDRTRLVSHLPKPGSLSHDAMTAATSDARPTPTNAPRHVRWSIAAQAPISRGPRMSPMLLAPRYSDSTRMRAGGGYESTRSGWWTACTEAVVAPANASTASSPQAETTKPVRPVRTAHPYAVTMQTTARIAFRWTMAASRSIASVTTSVLRRTAVANADREMPSAEVISGPMMVRTDVWSWSTMTSAPSARAGYSVTRASVRVWRTELTSPEPVTPRARRPRSSSRSRTSSTSATAASAALILARCSSSRAAGRAPLPVGSRRPVLETRATSTPSIDDEVTGERRLAHPAAVLVEEDDRHLVPVGGAVARPELRKLVDVQGGPAGDVHLSAREPVGGRAGGVCPARVLRGDEREQRATGPHRRAIEENGVGAVEPLGRPCQVERQRDGGAAGGLCDVYAVVLDEGEAVDRAGACARGHHGHHAEHGDPLAPLRGSPPCHMASAYARWASQKPLAPACRIQRSPASVTARQRDAAPVGGAAPDRSIAAMSPPR